MNLIQNDNIQIVINPETHDDKDLYKKMNTLLLKNIYVSI